MLNSTLLWQPLNPKTNLTHFKTFLESQTGAQFANYSQLHRWSVEHLDLFWSTWARYSGFKFLNQPTQTLRVSKNFWESEWFVGGSLNFAENLLAKGSDFATAIQFLREDGNQTRISYQELRASIASLATYLKSVGIQKGDCVCGLVPNAPIATIGMLATTSLGAVWSSASPDFGTKAVLDRFEQIQPKVFLSVDCYLFKGKKISILDKVSEISLSLSQKNKKYCATIVDSFLGEDFVVKDIPYLKRFKDLERKTADDLTFTPISFSDPVYVMFSSGTTGLPKCIVQGPGVLLNHTKELSLHCNLCEGDKIFYYTTCGWMMWNWSQSALAIGATLYLFDGNPFYPNWQRLWQWIVDEEINIFGTSAKYLSVLESEGATPKDFFSFSSLKTILSTGSPLFDSGFRYVYECIKEDVQLSSISGGTDLNGCFALGNPNLPVYSGEIQCLGLGMDVQVFDENGQSVRQEKGELVCLQPFPSMPLYFLNDPDQKKYKSAYFDRFENTWCHGDFAMLTEHEGMIIYGRSDATLNPGGVRIGTADIYAVIETIPEISDSVIIGQNWQEDVRIVLFVKIKEGHSLTDDLRYRIQSKIREQTSPRHVPSFILEVPEIPYTVNGKKVEIAVRQTVEGEIVKNKATLSNPNSLDVFGMFPELK